MKIRLLENGLFRNISLVFIGILVSRVILFAVSPLLTRFYTPDEFGKLGFIVSVSEVLISIASFKIELSIPLLKDEKVRRDVMAFCLRLILINFCVLAVLWFLFRRYMQTNHDLKQSESIFIIFIFLASGVSEIFRYKFIGLNKFKRVASSDVSKSLGQSIIPSLFILLPSRTLGLFWGEAAGRLFTVFNYVGRDIKQLKGLLIRRFHLSEVFNSVKHYVYFSAPARFLNTISIGMFPAIIGYFFGMKFLGFVTLSQRIVALPVNLLGRSISDAYYREATHFYVTGEFDKLSKVTLKIMSRLFFVALIPGAILYFYSNQIFSWFFGSQWVFSGTIVKYFIPFFITQLVASPISQIFNSIKQQRYYLIWEVIRFIASVVCLVLVCIKFKDPLLSVMYFSFSMAAVYLSFSVFVFYFLKVKMSGLK